VRRDWQIRNYRLSVSIVHRLKIYCNCNNHGEIMEIEVVMQARSSTVQDLVEQCARGELQFSGPDSLCSKVHAMGFSFNGLYEAVCYAEACMKQEKSNG
jgi:hypothetical protein